jgi:tetratricopeptide (TPR) repeat protein
MARMGVEGMDGLSARSGRLMNPPPALLLLSLRLRQPGSICDEVPRVEVLACPARNSIMTDRPIAFQLFLFGPFTVRSPEGTDLTPSSRKACAILAMLAVAPRGSRSRVWLRDKLWSDRGEDQASASLRQALLDIRKALGTRSVRALTADKNTVSLDLSAITVDALSFLDPEQRDALPAETEHFLEGIDVRDPEFEEWLTLERQAWIARIEDAGFAHQLDPKPMPGRAGRIAASAVPHTDGPARMPPLSQSQDSQSGWRVAIMPPVVLGGDSGVQVVQAGIQRSLVTSLIETGDLRVVDLAPLPFGDSSGGLLSRLPEQVHLSVQLRIFADSANLRAAIVLMSPIDNSMIWADEVSSPRREAADGTFALPLIVRATDEAIRHFLRRVGSETADAEGHIAAAVTSMFRLTRGDLDRSETILRRHLATSPTAQGNAWLAFLMTFRIGQRFNAEDAPLLEETQHLARRAMEMDPTNALVSALVGHVHSYLFGEFDYAAGLFETSLRVNPAQTLAWDLYAMLHAYAGQPKKALAMAKWARHLGAFSPHRYYFETTRAITGNFSAEHHTAIEAGSAALAERPDFNSLLRVLVSSHSHLDRPEEARVFLDRLLQVEPNFSITSLREAGYPGLDTEGGRHFVDGLMKAGVRRH